MAFLNIHSLLFFSFHLWCNFAVVVCLVLQCFTLSSFLAPVVVDGDPTKPKKTSKGKKKVKKSEPADLSVFDENAPSIFDDPALGQ